MDDGRKAKGYRRRTIRTREVDVHLKSSCNKG